MAGKFKMGIYVALLLAHPAGGARGNILGAPDPTHNHCSYGSLGVMRPP